MASVKSSHVKVVVVAAAVSVALLAGTTNAAVRPVYPLSVGSTSRYLVDRDGVPFLIVGDSPQSLLVNVSTADAARYLADRARAGFNSLWINLLCDSGTAGRADGSTKDGLVPFQNPGDLATPNEAYFAHVDTILQLAAHDGFAIFLDPIETAGWLNVLLANGTTKAYEYGRYLGTRYKIFQNIVWLNGNDFLAWPNPEADAVVLAVAQGIRDSDPGALQTLELDYPVSASLEDARWRQLLGLDAVYTYHPVYAKLLAEYGRDNALPTFLVEANYEFEYSYRGPETLRRQEYWAMLSGSTGQFYGNKYTWQFLPGWESHLDTSGSRQVGYLVRLFTKRPWFRLVPDRQHRVVVRGYGTSAPSGDMNMNDYVAAAQTPDGKLVIAYLPAGTPVTVQLNRLAGRTRAQWYDPTSGRYLAVPGSPFPNRGLRRFRPPTRNGGGDRDWLLVLTA